MIPTERVVIALGGNALSAANGSQGAVSDQAAAIGRALSALVPLFASAAKVAITHGNGPQVGNLLLRSEMSSDVLPPLPLDTCVADTQGGITYTIARELRNVLHSAGVQREVVGIVTLTAVRPGSGGLKPVGVEIPIERRADAVRRGWEVVELSGGKVRRIVASPEPVRILEIGPIRSLFDQGVIVIAAGGGGVPVADGADGIVGFEAVVDKDLASALLATGLGADTLLILTDVDGVKVAYGTAGERAVARADTKELRALQASGEFAMGSMGPKVEAVLRFVEHGGRRGLICHLDASMQALAGAAGTEITRRVGAP